MVHGLIRFSSSCRSRISSGGKFGVPFFRKALAFENALFSRGLSLTHRKSYSAAVSSSQCLDRRRNPQKYFSTQSAGSETEADRIKKDDQMVIAFTCTKCETRNTKTMSKLAYTKGVVIITCEGCRNTHLIADHLGWFEDNSTTVEDILKAKGENVVKIEGKVNDYEAIPEEEDER